MALGDGTAWDETVPVDATLAVQIDDYDRDLRKGVRSRMALEHEWPASQAATSQAGVHKFITLQEQAAKPTIAGTQLGGVYIKTVGAGLQELFFENEAGTEVQVSNRSGLSGVVAPTILQTSGATNITVTTTDAILMTDMSQTFTASGRLVAVSFRAPFGAAVDNGYGFVALYIDTTNKTGWIGFHGHGGTNEMGLHLEHIEAFSSGSYTANVYWKAGSASYGCVQPGSSDGKRFVSVVAY